MANWLYRYRDADGWRRTSILYDVGELVCRRVVHES